MPRLPHRVWMALRTLLRRRTADRELDDELQFHLEQMQALAVSRGENAADAQWRARRDMESLAYVKEACRDVRTLHWLDHALRDLRHGARLLARAPGFTAVAALSLGLGIGASSTIFSIVNTVVLRPLPIADSQELHIAQVAARDQVRLQFPSAVVTRATSLLAGRAHVAAHSTTEAALIAARSGGRAATPGESARLQLVTGGYFGTLRQRARIGRLLGPEDDRSLGAHPVAVISDRYWTRQFGQSADVLGQELVVNGTALTIVGVTAPEFFGTTVDPETPDIWAPSTMQAAVRFSGNSSRSGGDLQKPWPLQPEIAWLQVIVRVPAAVGAAAVAEAMTVAAQSEAIGGRGGPDAAVRVTLAAGAHGFSPIRSRLTAPLLVLQLAVGLLLAIACANIAGLLLARGSSRRREMAIRLSMGAGRATLIRQLLTESLLLSSVGGALGLVLAYWGSPALLAFLARGGPAVGIDVRPDWRVIAVTVATSTATAIAFGLVPALRGTRVPMAGTLKAQARTVVGDGGGGRMPLGKLLIAGQMAVAILLLLVAALFGRSLQALGQVDAGYDRDRVVMARIDPRSSGYALPELPALYDRLLAGLARLPGVNAVSASAVGPFSGARNRGHFEVEGYAPAPGEPMVTHKDWVTPDYFRTVGLALKQGRAFGPEDTATGRRVSVITEAVARRYFRQQNPIGKRWATGPNYDTHGYEIVGIVEDGRYGDMRTEAANMVYMPAAQADRYLNNLEIRTTGDPAALTAAIRDTLRATEPRLAVRWVETLEGRIEQSLGVEQLLGWLTSAFGAAALALSCMGLYGSLAYAVRRRTAELGLRIALGANRAAVQWLIVREALWLVLAGAAVGLPIAFIAGRGVGHLLYATTPSDPASYAMAVGVLVAVCAGAAYVPAWRASRLDPMIALRTD